MAKKKTKKTNQQITLIVFTLILLITASIFLIQKQQQKSLESRFKNVENKIKEIKNNESKEGVIVTQTNGCRRDKNKFSEGPMYCFIELNIQGQNLDREITKRISRSLSGSELSEKLQNDKSFSAINFQSEGTECSATYTEYKDIKEAVIFCSENSKRPFYPYKN